MCFAGLKQGSIFRTRLRRKSFVTQCFFATRLRCEDRFCSFVGNDRFFSWPRHAPDRQPHPLVGAVQVQRKIDELTDLDRVLYAAAEIEYEKVLYPEIILFSLYSASFQQALLRLWSNAHVTVVVLLGRGARGLVFGARASHCRGKLDKHTFLILHFSRMTQ